ncbi:hypothetical protein BHE74_00026342 [Ensete ventricosum]|nr:hypothetical protein GW17_00005386 [Ensete ventricosum]RWW66301.1 hypothetical protein BHE74_00026342 [Ensete ventricosum]RZR96270.1 hypothetical protein BHM03_00025250 [Ensete ventricosum]
MSSTRPDLGVSSDDPVADQLSPLSTGGEAEPTCQTSPLPDPRQLATSGVAGEARHPTDEQYPLVAGNRRRVRAGVVVDQRTGFAPFDKEVARRKEQSCHVTESAEAI